MKGRRQDAPPPARTNQGVQDHGHDAQTAGRKIHKMIAATTPDVGSVKGRSENSARRKIDLRAASHMVVDAFARQGLASPSTRPETVVRMDFVM